MARKAKLTTADVEAMRRADRLVLRVQNKYGRKAQARKYGISQACISKYLNNETKPIDHIYETGMSRHHQHTPIGHRRMQ